MENFKKNIQEFESRLDTAHTELADLYRELGGRLAADAADAADAASTESSAGAAQEWQTLRQDREEIARQIIQIKSTVDRLDEISRFSKQVVKLKGTQTKQIIAAKNNFVLALYDQYKNELFRPFEGIADSLEPLNTLLREIHDAIDTVKQDLSAASFFKKIPLFSKQKSLEIKAASIEKKIRALIVKEQEAIFAGLEQYPSVYTDFPEHVSQLYQNFKEASEGYSESETRESMLGDEKVKLEEILSNLSARKDSSKRIQELTNEAGQKDTRIDTLQKNFGIEYTDKFYDENGAALKDTDTPEQKYEETVNAAAAKRKDVFLYHTNISAEKLREQIYGHQKKIDSSRHAIESYKKTITEYKGMIGEAEQTITQTETQKKELEQSLSELEKIIE